MQAEIERVNGDTLSLKFPHLPAELDKDYDRFSLDIAEFESYTKDIYAWRSTLNENVMHLHVDGHDKIKWEQATIFYVQENTDGPRPYLEAHVGFRIYNENGKKADAQGRKFDGWSEKYDETIPIYSPRVQQYMSRSLGTFVEKELDVNADLDDCVTLTEGHDRVYCVPRYGTCLSSRFISLMNDFGSKGGFVLLLDAISKNQPDEHLTLTAMSFIITMISMPAKLFHRDWINQFAEPFCTAMTQ